MENKYKESCKKTQYPSDDNVIDLNEMASPLTEESDEDKENVCVKQQVDNIAKKNDFRGSGEPHCVKLEDISPFEFIKYWQLIKNDTSLTKLAKVLREIKPKELVTGGFVQTSYFDSCRLLTTFFPNKVKETSWPSLVTLFIFYK